MHPDHCAASPSPRPRWSLSLFSRPPPLFPSPLFLSFTHSSSLSLVFFLPVCRSRSLCGDLSLSSCWSISVTPVLTPRARLQEGSAPSVGGTKGVSTPPKGLGKKFKLWGQKTWHMTLAKRLHDTRVSHLLGLTHHLLGWVLWRQALAHCATVSKPSPCPHTSQSPIHTPSSMSDIVLEMHALTVRLGL